ncbi:Site-specific DNA recombinase [Jatrophihabitans endophyticus]|uniref:Site-specific DNA recombinase n=1 Tax=Jatrophihabitans endophyticus TaxID=1206085 RepID=A0A1M5HQG7_9ACTN|nr:recombinase family protein [Jatrophihabitans endophyticus]SHG18176.1 Site-specific DNA recombinase [Jatrophihabitans endophyticus]
MAHLYGYARVSTLEQDPALQHDALTAAGCARIFTDHASGKLDHRPQLDDLLERVLPGDTIVVWRLDRLGRNLHHLITTVTELGQRDIGFRSLTEGLDATTPAGRLLFGIMASLAQFERDLIRERTLAGLEAARARGRNGGRRTVMTPDKITVARQMYDTGNHTVQQIADTLGVGRATIYRHLSNEPSGA